MNPIELAYHSATEQWRAGFRAGVETAAREVDGTIMTTGCNVSAGFRSGWHSAKGIFVENIRSLLNESGAGEKI